MKAKTLIRLARRVPSPLLRLSTRRPTRGLVLRQVFSRMPELLSPAGRKASGVIRFEIGEDDDVDTWYVTLGGGTCAVSQSPDGVRPRATIHLSAYDFVRLATGADAIQLFAAGRLRIAGDTYFGASVGELFDIAR